MSKLQEIYEDYKSNNGLSPNCQQLINMFGDESKVLEDEEKQSHIIIALNDVDNKTDKDSPLYFNQEHFVHISEFKGDARPNPETTYFREDFYEKDGLAVVIPFYNEPASELCTTLTHLYHTYQYLCNKSELWNNKPFNICIIQDGWYKADSSMQEYLKLMFPGKMNNKNWWDLDEFTNYNEQRDGKNITFIFEKNANSKLNSETYFALKHPTTYVKGEKYVDYLEKDKQPKMNISLIIKIDNRRKHNSHEWFLGKQGFIDALSAKYFFCTDAYTMFKNNTLYELVNYLDKNKKCCGVTGRARAMNRRQQKRKGNERKTKEWTFSIDYLLRLTQIYDFELSGCVYNPTYHLVGFLPVLPGPCGLYRTKDIAKKGKDSIDGRSWYFDVVNGEPTETGLVLGNLRIAEDRVLSVSSILKSSEKNLRLAYCPKALFYFEAEVSLKNFISQRRRWINGTFAGYIFLLITNPSIFWKWRVNFIRKIIVFLVLLLNLIQMFALVISPALSFIVFESSLSYILSLRYDHYEALTDVIILANWCVWILHVIIHNTNQFMEIIIKALYILSVFISITLVVALFHVLVIAQDSITSVISIDDIPKEYEIYILYLIAFTFITPFINAILIDRGTFKTFGAICKAIIPFYLSFYLMVPWFSSYAFARCWDLTWGNRATSSEFDESNKNKDDINIVGEQEHSAIEEAKVRFSNWSKIVVLFMIIINVSLYLFVPLYYQALIMVGILITGAIFMAFSLIQIVFSIIFDTLAAIFRCIWYIICCRCCRSNKSNKTYEHVEGSVDSIPSAASV